MNKQKRFLVILITLCLCFTSLMPLAMAEEGGQGATDPDKVIYFTYSYYDYDEQKTKTPTDTISLEEMAAALAGDGHTLTAENILWEYFVDFLPYSVYDGVLFDGNAFYVKLDDSVDGLLYYDLNEGTGGEWNNRQVFRPGMHVFCLDRDDLYSILLSGGGDDIFHYNNESVGGVRDLTVHVLKNQGITWGNLFYDFFKSWHMFGAVPDREIWRYGHRDDTLPTELIKMDEKISGGNTVTPVPLGSEAPLFKNYNYYSYYKGTAVDLDDACALVPRESYILPIWYSDAAFFEMMYGHDLTRGYEGVNDSNKIINSGKYKVRKGVPDGSANNYNTGMRLTIMAIPVVVEVGEFTKAAGASDPTFTATVRLDEDALLTSADLPAGVRFDEVAIETMKALIAQELGDSFFTFTRDSGETAGATYTVRADEKDGVDEAGGVNQYGNFDIRYVPGKLTITESEVNPPIIPDPKPDPEPEEPEPEIDPISVTLSATKIYNGHAPEHARFSFNLADAQNSVIQTKTNANNGDVVFDALTFDEAGTYVYYISEVNSAVPVINYDASVYTVTITVTEEDNVLSADVNYALQGEASANGAVFMNTSIPIDPENPTVQIPDPETPGAWMPDPESGEWIFVPEEDIPLASMDPEVPETGDTASTFSYWMMFTLSTAALAAILLGGRYLKKAKK